MPETTNPSVDKEKELEAKYGSLSHSDLLQARLKAKTPQEQKEIAPFEHRAFAREYVEQNPVSGTLGVAAAIPAYQAAKAVGAVGSRTGPSLEQVKQGYKGIAEGIDKAVEPWKMGWQRLRGMAVGPDGKTIDQVAPTYVQTPPEASKTASEPWNMSWKDLMQFKGTAAVKPPKGLDIDSYVKNLEGAESGGNPNAKASTSTATGLHQFTEATWMDEVRRQKLPYTLADRTDPAKSREVVRGFTLRNVEKAREDLGRDPSQVELYMYHFLGDAGKFLTAPKDAKATEQVSAKAVKANKNVFFDKEGMPRTVQEVLDRFKGKFK